MQIVARRYKSLGKARQVSREAWKHIVISVAVLIAIGIFVTTFILLGHSCSHRGSTLEGPISEQWVARYNRLADGVDYAYAVAVDALGNVYITGTSSYHYEGNDYITVKYNSNGSQLWAAYYNGPASSVDSAKAIVVDELGNVYITGGSTVEGDFGESGFDYDSTTIKYDSDGNQLWIASYSGPGKGYDETSAIALDNSGNVYVTGASTGDGTESDYATIKYDSNGNQLWVARYNGPVSGYDTSQAIAVDDSGNIYVTGYSKGSDIQYDYDYAIIKYDSNGNQLWVARYDGPASGYDRAYAVVVDQLGNVYITGESHHSGEEGHKDVDSTTISYDTDGNEVWIASYNGLASGFDITEAMAIDSAGNIYVAGFTDGGDTNYDCLIIKYTPK